MKFNILKKYYVLIFLLVLTMLPFLLNFSVHTIQSYVDFYIFNTNKVFSSLYSWDNLNLGQNSLSSLWRIFPLSAYYDGLNYILKVPPNITNIVLVASLFLAGFISFYLFIMELFRKSLSVAAAGLGSFFFVFNLYTLLNVTSTYIFIAPYVALPLQLYLLLKSIRSDRRLYFGTLLGLLTASIFGINLVFSIMSLVILVIFGFWQYIIMKETKLSDLLKSLSAPILIGLALCLWWLIPFILGSLLDAKTTGYLLGSEGFLQSRY